MASYEGASSTRKTAKSSPFFVTAGGASAGRAAHVDIAPTVAVSPAAGAIAGDLAAAQATPLVVSLSSDPTLAIVAVRYPGAANEVVAYRRGSFRQGFTAHSYEVTNGAGVDLHILPDSGAWPDSGAANDISFDVDAVAGGALSDIGASS